MTAAQDVPSELVVAESHVIEPSAESASRSMDTYLAIQRVADTKMPDAIMEIQGKKFRKKPYWRYIATAFHIDTAMISEERIEIGDDWGYVVLYRATAPDGRVSEIDGSCMASEKRGAMCTLHNVRAHAHTRAKNRAISDLVGFGEVSADELGPDAFAGESERTYNEPPPPEGPPNEEVRKDGKTREKGSNGTLSKAQIKSLGVWRAGFKASEAVHGKDEDAKWNSINWALDAMGFSKVDEVPDDRGEELITRINEYPQAQQASGEAPF
jgi:hypothetical protein